MDLLSGIGDADQLTSGKVDYYYLQMINVLNRHAIPLFLHLNVSICKL